MSDQVTLYYNPMSRGRTVHWMLEEIGVPYETKILKWETGDNKSRDARRESRSTFSSAKIADEVLSWLKRMTSPQPSKITLIDNIHTARSDF